MKILQGLSRIQSLILREWKRQSLRKFMLDLIFKEDLMIEVVVEMVEEGHLEVEVLGQKEGLKELAERALGADLEEDPTEEGLVVEVQEEGMEEEDSVEVVEEGLVVEVQEEGMAAGTE